MSNSAGSPIKTSLRLKLILAFLLVSLISAGLSAFFIQRRTRSEFDRFLDDQGRAELVTTLRQFYALNGSWKGVENYLFLVRTDENVQMLEPDLPGVQDGSVRPNIRRLPYMLVDVQGRILLGNPERYGEIIDLKKEKGYPIEIRNRLVGWLIPIRLDGSAANTSPEQVFLEGVNRALLFSGVISLALALLLGGFFARTLTQSLRQVTEGTQRIAQGELGYQVQVNTDDEVGELANAFNQMSFDLEKSSRARQQMTADIAHDLRTPLSVLLGYTEALSDGKLEGTPDVYAIMHMETRHLKLLIDDLRTLSLADAGELPLNRQLSQPVALLQRTAAAMRPQAEAQGVQIHVHTTEVLPAISVDPERMAQVLGNLVANALRYTPENGEIRLSARAEQGKVILDVQDSGEGIASEDLPHIFNRFYRGSESRHPNGEAGLGLAIAKSLVEAHGGKISVVSKPGMGAKFTIIM